MSRIDFIFGNDSRPLIIGINHSDGSRQTEQIPLFDSARAQRYLNLGPIGRNPAALLPLALEQDKESRHLIDIVYGCSMKVAVEQYSQNGTTVVCIGLNCQFCEKNIARVTKVNPPYGSIDVHNNIPTKFPYCWDISAHKKNLSCKKNFCMFCNCDLKQHSWREFLDSNPKKPVFEMTSTEDYAQADRIFCNHALLCLDNLRVLSSLILSMELNYQCLKALSSMPHTWQS